MKELLKLRNEALDKDDVCWDKLKGAEVKGGSQVEIRWKDWGDEFIDEGYLFELPGITMPDEADLFVHVKHPNNPSGKDAAPEQFTHLHYLLGMDLIESIKIINPSNQE